MQTGTKRKFLHCGSTPAARVWKSQFGVGFKCFRCHEDDFEKFGQRSIADVLEARNALNAIDERATKIPPGAVPLSADGVPHAALLWVLKTGLTPEVAAGEYHMAWHEDTRRVFIPIGSDMILARAVYKEDTPKYKLFGRMKAAVFTAQGRSPLVVVEDILSAIKVNRAGYSAAAVLGTSVTPEIAAELASKHTSIVLWLDPDKAGMSGRSAIKKSLALYPVDVLYARSTIATDPKYQTREQIQATIEDTMKHGS